MAARVCESVNRAAQRSGSGELAIERFDQGLAFHVIGDDEESCTA
jgi:hypothetical protein